MNRAVLSILVSNHFGVLTRVTNLFSQRGFNIDSLAVGETENENYSRITITTSGDAASVNQIKLQLDKLFIKRKHLRFDRTGITKNKEENENGKSLL